jgi:hypothetical protein
MLQTTCPSLSFLRDYLVELPLQSKAFFVFGRTITRSKSKQRKIDGDVSGANQSEVSSRF